MVRVEIGGKPVLDINYREAADAMLQETRRVIRPRGSAHGEFHHHMDFKWNNMHPRLVLTSDTPDFDPEIIGHFKEEGFQVSYLPYDGDRTIYHAQLQQLADTLELGERYAIVGT